MKFKLLFFIAAIVLSISACTESDTAATISIAEGYITINAGETHDLDVDINVAAGTSVQFTTKDPNVATVSENGQVTAVGRGETLVTVRSGGATDYVVIRVLGDAVVAYDASDFLAAYDNGDYRIELRDDIVLSEVLEIDRALEIVFNGYTLTADVLVTQAFEGGIALNNELPFETLMTMTDEDARAFIGTIDMNGFYVKVFINYIDIYVPDTFDMIFINPYKVGNLTFDFLAEYMEIGDAVPVSSINDLIRIQSYEPNIFAEGTPYEKVVLRPYEHEEYVLVSDVKGLTTIAGERTVVVGDDDQVYVFNDDILERSFENRETGGYQFFYENTLFSYDQSGTQTSDFVLSDAINTYLTDNTINIFEVYTLFEYQYELVEEYDTYLDNLTLDGRGFDVEYFELEENDSLFEEASGRIDIFDIEFKDLVGSAKDTDYKGLIFSEIDADSLTFQNVDIEDNHYVVESDGEENFGILAGYVDRASILVMNAMTIENNTMHSMDGDDLAIVFGQLEDSIAQISDISIEYNIIYQDDGDNIYDVGLFVGFMFNVTMQVNYYESQYNLIDTLDGNDFGLFAGTIDDSILYMNEISFYEEKLRGEDNIGAIVGELIDSYLTGNMIYLDSLDFIGKNTQGFVVGETDDSFVEFNEIEVYSSSMVGTYELGGFIGQMSSSSQLKINEFELDESSIKGSYDVGGVVGEINSSILVALGGDIDESTFEGYYQIGGMIGVSNYSDITIIRTYFYDMDFYVDYDAGTFIGQSYYSDVFISDSSISSISFLDNIIDTENPGPMYDVGGAIGNAYESNVVITRVDFDLSNTISGTFNIGGVVGRVNEGYLEVTLSDIDVYIEADSNIGGLVGYLDDAVVDVRNTDVALTASDLNDVIDLNRVGGLVGYAGSSSISVFNVYANAYADEVVEKFGGLVGHLDDATLVARNSGVDLNANENVVDIDLKDVGGLVGYAHTAQISLFKVYANTFVDEVVENFGGFIGYMYLTHMDALNVSVDIDVDFDSTRENFNADNFGEFVGYEDFGTIEIYYQNLDVSSTEDAAEVITDLFTGKYVGTGTYETIIEVG